MTASRTDSHHSLPISSSSVLMPPVLPHAARHFAGEAPARTEQHSPTCSPPAAWGSPTQVGGLAQRTDQQPLPPGHSLNDQEAQERTTTRPCSSTPLRSSSSAAVDDDERTLASPAEPASTSAPPLKSKLTNLSGLVKRRRRRVPLEVRPLSSRSSSHLALMLMLSSSLADQGFSSCRLGQGEVLDELRPGRGPTRRALPARHSCASPPSPLSRS